MDINQRIQVFLIAILLCTFVIPTQLYAQRSILDREDIELPRIASQKFFLKLSTYKYIPADASRIGIQEIDEVLERIGVDRIKPFARKSALSKGSITPSGESISRIHVVYFDSPADPRAIVSMLDKLPSVEYASPYIYYPWSHVPNDPLVAQQWELTALRLQEAWDVTTGDSSLVIGHIDSGVDHLHADLALNIYRNPGEWGTDGELSTNGIDDDGNGLVDDYRGWDYIGSGDESNPLPDNDPYDSDEEHGTSTASCAAATTNNNEGMASSSYRAKLLPIKVSGDSDAGPVAVYEGFRYAADMGCDIISVSIRFTAFELRDRVLEDLIDYATDNGALVVNGSGNSGDDIENSSTDGLRRTLLVGATNSSGRLASFSTYGTMVDVYAPGVGVTTAAKGGGYNSSQGSSFSTPLVAGIAALVKSVHPEWTPEQIAKQIRVTSSTIGTGRNPKQYGIADAYRAVTENSTLQDIPGLHIREFAIQGENGPVLSRSGEQATITLQIQNLLAPTTENARVEIEYDPSLVVLNSPAAFDIGAIATLQEKEIIIDFTLRDSYKFSEGAIPFRLRFTDGEYIDYDIIHAEFYVEEAFHTVFAPGILTEWRAIDIATPDAVWAVGYIEGGQHICLRTVDGGNSWDVASGTGFPYWASVPTICGIDENTAMIGTYSDVGYDGGVYITTNGGASWVKVDVWEFTEYVSGLHMFDRNNGILFGDPIGFYFGIAKTSDGGYSWSVVSDPPIGLLPSIAPHGFAVRENNTSHTVWFTTYLGEIHRSMDAGETWETFDIPYNRQNSISFRDSEVGMVRFYESSSGSGSEDAIALTEDGGESWTAVEPEPTTYYGQVVLEPYGKRAWVLNEERIFVSSDLANSWDEQPIPDVPFIGTTAHDTYLDGDKLIIYAGGLYIFRMEVPYQAATSVESPNEATNFKVHDVFPNPVSLQGREGIHVRYSAIRPDLWECSVYNLAGEALFTQHVSIHSGEGVFPIPLDVQSNGTYILQINSKSGMVTKQFTVTR